MSVSELGVLLQEILVSHKSGESETIPENRRETGCVLKPVMNFDCLTSA